MVMPFIPADRAAVWVSVVNPPCLASFAGTGFIADRVSISFGALSTERTWERQNFSDRVAVRQKHDQTIDTCTPAAGRGQTMLERVDLEETSTSRLRGDL